MSDISNELFLPRASAIDHSIYDLIIHNDRRHVEACIDEVKSTGVYTDGGFVYGRFTIVNTAAG